MKRFSVSCFLAIAVLLCSGCHDSELQTYPVRGVVRFPDGKMLRQGSIEFESLDTETPQLARAEIQPDGSFVLGTHDLDDGALAGRHRAVVIANHMIGNGAERPGMIPKSPLHPKHANFRTSELEFVIQEKTNNIIIEVQYAPDDQQGRG
jgi:hypothetical protein